MSYLESEALCPYYIEDRFGVLKCEIGTIKLKDAEMMRQIGYAYCADKYKECPFKVALDGYYARNDVDASATDGEDDEQVTWFD